MLGPRLRNLAIERLIFPAGDLLLGTDMMARLREHRSLARRSEAELEQIQTSKLGAILRFAVERSPHYRDLGVRLEGDPRADLAKFPILTKPVLRASGERMLTRPRGELVHYPTSGSSGIQTDVYLDKAEEANCRAILLSWWEWTGFYLGKPIVQTGITPHRGLLKSIKDRVTQTVYLDAFAADDATFVRTLRTIEGKRGYHLGGYPSSLYLMALAAKKHGLDVRFDAAIAWGDKLFAHYEKAIQDAFGCRVYENYGLNEGFLVGQKADLPYFYVYTPHLVVEIVDASGAAVPDGELGHVVLTKLDGFAMPLIRYATGDLAVMLPRARYPAQRAMAFPLMERVIGRDTDIVRTPEGRYLVVHSFTGIFEFFPAIRQFKIIQRRADAIEIEYIPDPTFDPAVLGQIERRIHELARTKIRIEWRTVSQIPASKSGKPQLIESHLDGLKLS